MWIQSLSFLLHQRWLKVSPAYLWSGSCQACEYKASVSFYTSAGWKYPQHICDLDPARCVNTNSQFPFTPALAESIPSISVIWILPSMWRQSLSFLLHQRWLKVSPAYLWSGSCQVCEYKVSVSSNSPFRTDSGTLFHGDRKVLVKICVPSIVKACQSRQSCYRRALWQK